MTIIAIDQRRRAIALETIRATLRALNVTGKRADAVIGNFTSAYDALNGCPGLQDRLVRKTRDEIHASNRDPTPPKSPTRQPVQMAA